MPPKRHLSEEELEAAKQRKAEYDRQRRQAMCDEAKACERERIRNLRDCLKACWPLNKTIISDYYDVNNRLLEGTHLYVTLVTLDLSMKIRESV